MAYKGVELKFNLTRLLEKKGMSLSELSRRTGIRPQTLVDISHGRIKRIPVRAIERICVDLGVDVRDLFFLQYTGASEKEGAK